MIRNYRSERGHPTHHAIEADEPTLLLAARDPTAIDTLETYRQLLVYRGESVEWLDPVLEEFRAYAKRKT